jgi:hypothetical protein
MHTYIVSVRAERPNGEAVWNKEQIIVPKKCTCCARDVLSDTYLPEVSTFMSDGYTTAKYSWRFPCCAQCLTHIKLAMKHFRRQDRKAVRQAVTQECCSPSEPVRYIGFRASNVTGDIRLAEPITAEGSPDFIVGPNGVAVLKEDQRRGSVHVFEFKNRTYAELFAKANGVQMRISSTT